MVYSTERQAYDTHFNYIGCLSDLMDGVLLRYNGSLKKAALPYIGEKDNLISLTKKSLNDELAIVNIDEDYSYASTSWLPIKSYYLIFNVLLTIEYVFNPQKHVFRTGHSSCVDEFTRKLQRGEIEFSEPTLNQVFDGSILDYRVAAGANLSSRTSTADMYKMALRKIAHYKEEDWRRKNSINLRKSTHKIKYNNYLRKTLLVSIFDFPYYMRIRSNYRDFAFIDGISTAETAEYFKKYFNFTARFVRALEKLKKDSITARS
ncbi:MAG TPA: hypothetical protein VNF51_02000 [Candidatus Paceibacterota bacterium]|nr:hypothetical protein [Candidatus Paceibacterota bacterium]